MSETSGGGPVFHGTSELAALMRRTRWEDTALGPVDTWPTSLLSAASICVGSRFPIAIYWGPQLALLYNDAWRPILGTKHPWALGQGARAVWPEIWDDIGPLFEQVMSTGEATYSEDALLPMHRHGYTEECYFNFTFTPVRGEAGHVEGVFNAVIETTFRVISERRTRVLRELAEDLAPVRAAEEVFARATRSLARATRDVPYVAVYLVTRDGGEARRVACEGIEDVLPPVVALDGASSIWRIEEAIRTGRAVAVTRLDERLDVTLPGGAWPEPSREAIVAPVTAAGRVAAVLVLGANPRRAIDDVYLEFGERAAAQIGSTFASADAYAAERRRAEELAELDRAKTAFFSNVSHEFRTPLTLMLGPEEDLLAETYGPIATPQRHQLELLHRNTLRLHKLVNSLLDFARLEAGRVRASFVRQDLAQLTRDVASAFRSAADRAGLRLDVDCATIDAPTFVDRDMWEKIVLNLVSNALKFTFEGTISVSLRREGEHVVLRVRDTGVGVPAAEVPRLFERFHRVENARARTHEGSGIGLALVDELARLHGGGVAAESVEGAGTTFTVTIPVGAAHLPPEQVAAEAPAASSTTTASFVAEATRWLPGGEATAPRAAPRSAARILLADDNADMRDFIRRILEPEYVVDAVEDGAKALEAARARPPDLVLTDVMMPQLDGFGLLRALRADEATRSIPVIVLSARAGEEAKVGGLRSGADDYLVKPFSAPELSARIATHLELSRLRRVAEAERDRLHALLSGAPAVINFLRGPELVLELVHPLLAARLAGRRLQGRPLLDAIPELRAHSYPALLRRVVERGERVALHEEVLRLEGEPRPSYWSGAFLPVRDAGGAIEGVMTFLVDVTVQVEARQRVEASERTFRGLVEQVAAGIAQVDPTGRFLYVNERYREIVGRPERELVRARVQDLTHPDDVAALDERLARLAEAGETFGIDTRLLRPDGSIVWARSSVSRIEDADGSARLAIVSIDITQRRLAEEAIVQARERAVELQQATARFASATRPQDIADVWIDLARTAVGAAAAVVYLSRAGRLELAGSFGLDPVTVDRRRVLDPDAPLPLVAALRAGEPRWYETYAQLIAAFPGVASSRTPQAALQAAAALPLVHEGRALGGVALSFAGARAFGEAERSWLENLAAQSVLALERVRLHDEERRARQEAETLLRVAEAFATSQHDLDALVQRVTDEATAIVAAEFGAFFYNTTGARGESYVLYTLSGAPMEAFAKFELPRNTPLFGPTFRGEGVVRIHDVKADPRYGQVPPHHGMPEGHLPVTSYLAVPVIARSGAVLGGLFFGHPEAGRFTEAHERLVLAIAASAAVGIENAKLFRLTREAEEHQARRARLASFASAVGAVFTEGRELREVLRRCAELAVEHLDASVARIWTIEPGAAPLELQASAGAPGAAVAVAQELVERVAASRVAHVGDDPGGSRAILPLVVGDGVVGVFAVLAAAPLTTDSLETLTSVASTMAIGIERLHVERQRAHLLDELQQTLRFSEMFVGVLGHDLRNPLGAIVTGADVLMQRDANERIARPLQRIRNSADRMKRMIEQILDFTRARLGGGIPLVRTEVDLRSVAAQVVEELESAAPQPVAVEVRGDTTGCWDGDRLAQCVSNLLGNAIEHGGADAPIQIEIDGTSDTHVRLRLSNQGSIPEPLQAAVFDPFRRAKDRQASRSSKGLGLGLYIVQQVVHAHGGTIVLRSRDGEGTTFTISLPRAAPDAPP